MIGDAVNCYYYNKKQKTYYPFYTEDVCKLDLLQVQGQRVMEGC